MFLELTTYPHKKKLLIETTGLLIQPSNNPACPKGSLIIPQGHAAQLVVQSYDDIRARLYSRSDLITFPEKE